MIGLVAFGGGGFAAGWFAAPRDSGPVARPTAKSASASPSLPPYEQSQLAINRTKFSGNLVTFSRGWVPYVAGCTSSGDRNGPKLNAGEAARVSCNRASTTVYFVEYRSAADRDKARTQMLAQNIDAQTLTPGASQPKQNPDGLKGNYVEYSFKSGEQQRIVAGIWWDSAEQPVAAYVVSFWTDGLGGSWDPLRDLWRRSL